MKCILYIITLIFAVSGLSGCISDSFTDSPSDLLSFSAETVSFDTVFTDVGTPTARLKVYNHAKKALNISHISFRNPTSNFRLNVDGMTGSSFRDVEVRGGDSIFVFIECFIPENRDAEPFLISDNLDFITNGVTQSVEVNAWGQNVVRLKNRLVDSDLILTAERPYVIFDSLVVAPDVTLRIEPGARLLFHDKASLSVHGRILAEGDAENHIHMRGDRLDNVLPDIAYDILAGQWDGITIHPESHNNRLAYVNMRSTVYGLKAINSTDPDLSKIEIVNSWLHNSRETVFHARNCNTAAYGVCFSEAADAVVRLSGGTHNFSQCTFANEYLFSIPQEAILTLSNILPEETEDTDRQLITAANIDNSIFYGIPPEMDPGNLTGSDVFVRFCSIGSNGTDDDNFINCFWDTDPMFLTVREEYIFDYRVQPDSPVIDKGNPELVAPQTLTDMFGVPRLENGNPTLGAFQK